MKTSRKTLVAVCLVILVAFVGVLFGVGFRLQLGSIYHSGWEIDDRITAVGYENPNTLTHMILTQHNQFTSPNFISDALWKVDIDAPTWGLSTLQVMIGDIHHVDFTGRDIPNDQAAEELTVTRGNNTFYLDYHMYLYTVTIRTVADAYMRGMSGILNNQPTFEHETSWPYQSSNFLFSGTIDTPPRIGKEFDGGVYVKFVIQPWNGYSYHDAPSGYVLNDAWAGVMNSYIMPGGFVAGQVPNQFSPSDNNPGGTPKPEANAPWTQVGGLAGGDKTPMFLDDGTFGVDAPRVDWDAGVTPDTRIQSTVVNYFPVHLEAGCKTHSGPTGFVDEIYPCDVYVMYTVRVDVLQTHQFTLQTAYKPPTPEIPSDAFYWAESWWTTVLHGLDPFAWLGPLEPLAWWLLSGGIVILVIVVLVAIFAPWVLPRLAGTARSTYKAAKGK
jgi:hypothetical protein